MKAFHIVSYFFDSYELTKKFDQVFVFGINFIIIETCKN